MTPEAMTPCTLDWASAGSGLDNDRPAGPHQILEAIVVIWRAVAAGSQARLQGQVLGRTQVGGPVVAFVLEVHHKR